LHRDVGTAGDSEVCRRIIDIDSLGQNRTLKFISFVTHAGNFRVSAFSMKCFSASVRLSTRHQASADKR
jgi:hypothetical protein